MVGDLQETVTGTTASVGPWCTVLEQPWCVLLHTVWGRFFRREWGPAHQPCDQRQQWGGTQR